MKKTSFLKNIFMIMASNGILLISQILVGLVLPKLLNIDGFGNYRIFMLYGTYASLLHFGFVDGILVKFGGQNFQSLDSRTISKLFTSFFILEFCIAIIIDLLALCMFEGKYRWILCAVGIYTFFLNVETAFQFLSQAIMNFGLVARMSKLQALLNTFNICVPLICIFIFKLFSSLTYTTYITLYIAAYAVLLLVYVYIYIVKYKMLNFNLNVNRDIVYEIFKIGFPITIASQIGNIILNLDNQFVSMFFSTNIFAKYSFSYNLISLTIAIVLAISTVLFPYLNRETKSDLIKNYSKSMAFMLLFIYATLFSYFPIKIIITYILPQYVGSLVYLRILLPGVAITTSISTIIFNHYKVTEDMKLYLKNGLISLVISLILYCVAYYLFKDVIVLAFSSLIALFIWFFIEDYFFRKKYNIIRYKDYFYIILCTLSFQLITDINNMIFSIFLYAVIYLALSYFFEKDYFNFISKKLLYRFNKENFR